MPDTVDGKKVRFATWKMVERVTHKLADEPYCDDAVIIGVCLTYTVQTWLRAVGIISTDSVLFIIWQLITKMSREVLHLFITKIWNDYAAEIIEIGQKLHLI
jgi:hypothetical protein